jgi:hypothetical protein
MAQNAGNRSKRPNSFFFLIKILFENDSFTLFAFIRYLLGRRLNLQMKTVVKGPNGEDITLEELRSKIYFTTLKLIALQ